MTRLQTNFMDDLERLMSACMEEIHVSSPDENTVTHKIFVLEIFQTNFHVKLISDILALPETSSLEKFQLRMALYVPNFQRFR